ncbi:MAG: galactose mutarotase [Gammaproteobacteria bacterium]|nr:galactose mutarotase [Gammaproteobacteria bacterium]
MPGGVRVCVIELGAVVTRMEVPDRSGRVADVVLGYDDLAGYAAGASYFGAVVGRYANRIAGGRFTLDGRVYSLSINDAVNHLHGGESGFDKRHWRGVLVPDGVRLTLTSPAGDAGYPGALSASVTYTLDDANVLDVRYLATSDAPTVVNLAQHSYFNLAGTGDITGHELMINAASYTPVDNSLIPTGEILRVDDTPFDFRTPKTVGRDIGQDHPQLLACGGYDHNFVLAGHGFRHAATLTDPESGSALMLHTDQPGLQFYSGNFLGAAMRGKSGATYGHRAGLCLETQHFPNSPNVAHFPSTVLRPGETFASRTGFAFGVRK